MTTNNGTSRLSWFNKLELICSGILFGAFNNITTILNAKVLFEENRVAAGSDAGKPGSGFENMGFGF